MTYRDALDTLMMDHLGGTSTTASSTASTSSASSMSSAELFKEMQSTLRVVQMLTRREEQAFEESMLALGVDLRAGQSAIFPMGTKLPGVPHKYRDRVRVAQNDYAGNRVLILPSGGLTFDLAIPRF